MTKFDLNFENEFDVVEFDRLIEKESEKKVLTKLYYLRLRAKGLSVSKASDLINIKRSTAYHLDDVWRYEGYNGLLHKKGAGRDLKINKNQLEKLREILNEKDQWTIQDILKIVKKNFNIEYSYTGMQKLLNTHFNINIINSYENKQYDKLSILDLIRNSELEDLEIEELIVLLKNEKDLNVFKKLIYILFKKLGFSTDLSAYILSITTRTGNNWLKNWNNEKYDGLIHKPGQGRKPKMDKDQLESLKKT